MAKTVILRATLIEKLASAAKKSVTILDTFAPRGEVRVEIEQKHRAVVTTDVLSLFDPIVEGRSVLAHSPITSAVLFFKSTIGSG